MTEGINKGMSNTRRAKKKARHMENMEYRRNLNRAKASCHTSEARARIQVQIDEIGKRGKS